MDVFAASKTLQVPHEDDDRRWSVEECHAALTIIGHAADVADCRALMLAVGLIPWRYDGPYSPKVRQKIANEAARIAEEEPRAIVEVAREVTPAPPRNPNIHTVRCDRCGRFLRNEWVPCWHCETPEMIW